MSSWLAIGVGCCKGCPAATIVGLIQSARHQLDNAGDACLFTVIDKMNERGLMEAAAALRLDLRFLPREALAAVMDEVRTTSAAAEARFGIASVSEAAALAGAGPGARLLLARIARDGATCAIAGGAGSRG